MASSQVEIASSSPFSCVLRDDNRRDRYNSRASFQNNLKDLVRDHLQSCISAPSRSSVSESSEDSNRQTDNAESSVFKEQSNADNGNSNKRSKIHDRWARTREIVFSNSPSSNSFTFQRENSPAHSDGSVEIPNLGGVSSLVQKWRDFEAEAKNLNSPVSSRSNSGSTFTENTSFVEMAHRGNDVIEYVGDERNGTPTVIEEYAFGDWESDRTVPSGTPSSRGRDSDAAESERLRVTDIIKKLSSANAGGGNDNNDCEQRQAVGNDEVLPRVRTPTDQPEKRGLRAVASSPRIRGRQAFSDLLMQMERDRIRELEGLVERKAVSGFSHKGRIQALLRLRFLRRGTEVRDRRHCLTTSDQSSRLKQSTIMHLREKFGPGFEHGAADSRTPNVDKSSASSQLREVTDNTTDTETSSLCIRVGDGVHHKEVTKSKSPIREVTNNNAFEVARPCTANQLDEDIHQDANSTVQQNVFDVQHSESPCAKANPMSCVLWPVASSAISNFGSQESANESASLTHRKEKTNAEEQVTNNPPLITSSHDWYNDGSHLQIDLEEQEVNNRHLKEVDCDYKSDAFHRESELEEHEFSDQQLFDTSHDWINDVSRPRRDWEGLRQARYQEMLDPYMDNGDIRQLLERRSVSTFLSSGMRERIDQLMMSRTQRHPDHNGSKVEEDVEQEGKQREDVEDDGEEEEEEDEGEDEEDERLLGNHYEETGEYYDQTTSSLHPASPSVLMAWSRNQDYEYSDDSDQFSSPSIQKSQLSKSSSQDNRHSFINHPSIEMDLIYDLRGHMEQLHQEISELQKSVNSCRSMQVKLQRSIKHEVAAAVNYSEKKLTLRYIAAQRAGKESSRRGTRKGRCCVCREMQVDSLLYRCGHMCTCFQCAHTLQWSSGKCPICQAPILDVVRAYSEDR
ncbi:hypothetical protein RJ639_020833 [Escallonia herrerae]|uniref:RING-type domain-containing protein n=1 Tax=Escallonia herrerae TaxID=1293975 RepID=A0AA88V516_9ASTE|nr:hypothetical protein RJ639_020833 [Escallonia herrerae]